MSSKNGTGYTRREKIRAFLDRMFSSRYPKRIMMPWDWDRYIEELRQAAQDDSEYEDGPSAGA